MRFYTDCGRFAVSVFLCLAMVLTMVPAPLSGASAPVPCPVRAAQSSCLAAPLSAADLFDNFGKTFSELLAEHPFHSNPAVNKAITVVLAAAAAAFFPLLFLTNARPTAMTDELFFPLVLGVVGLSVFVRPAIYAMSAGMDDEDMDFGIKDKAERLFGKLGLHLDRTLAWINRAARLSADGVRVFALVMAFIIAFIPGFSLYFSTDTLASFETAPSAAEIQALKADYAPAIVQDTIDNQLKTPLYDRLLNNPANIRSVADAAYYQQVPRALLAAILSTEINTVGMELRQTAEALARQLRSKNTTTTGIAEIQLVNAVELLPRLYDDIVSDPSAPAYIREALVLAQIKYQSALGVDIFDPAVISQTKNNGALLYADAIDDILQCDAISIFLGAMFIRDAMEALYEADPELCPDPDAYSDLSADVSPLCVGAVQIYYIQGPAYVLNPESTQVLLRETGSAVAPDGNIYNINIAVRRGYTMDFMPFTEYLAGNALADELSLFGPVGLSEIMTFVSDYWVKNHVITDDHARMETQGRAVMGFTNLEVFEAIFAGPGFAPATWDPYADASGQTDKEINLMLAA